ncbi:branched-chain amino acid ABC transporter permease [Pseudomonas cavernae]|uniref:Branched-chain amino acid ABC transporter permease n=2 Tax=Pseudomonas cavernae TaxID=2320867 RepID=A0A385Z704_9PSED|nr:branched-chain amino acid ABC transporter permease [Pseudomonas cavernae]
MHASPRTHPGTRWGGLLFLLALITLASAVPFMPYGSIRVADSILIYILLGLGLNIVVGYCGLLDLGFVAFYAVGAYTYGLLASPHLGLHLPFLAILPIGIMLSGFVGVLLGFPVLRLRGDYLAIVTLGFGEIIRILINNLDRLTNGPRGLSRLDRPSIGGEVLSTPLDFYWLLLVAVAVCMVIVYRLEGSLQGKAWFALREDQDAASGVGINTTRIKLTAFAVSAAIAGGAGVIFATFQRFVSPESFTLHESILIVLMIVIGGAGNILGIIVGTLVMILIPEILREYSEYRMLIMGLMMVVIILVRPEGLVPRSFGPRQLFRVVLNK